MTTDPGLRADQDKVKEEIYEAFRKMKEKDYAGAEAVLQEGLKKVEEEKSPTRSALFYSSLGVLAKIRGEFKEAWRCYEKAERLMPDDPSLKIITAKLLMDQFAQYDTAIKKLKQVLKVAKGSGTFIHHAHAVMAVAYLKKGDKRRAIEMLDLAMGKDFSGVTSAHHLNFEVIEAFLARNLEVERCKLYVEKALNLAKDRGENKPIRFLSKLLESFEVTLH